MHLRKPSGRSAQSSDNGRRQAARLIIAIMLAVLPLFAIVPRALPASAAPNFTAMIARRSSSGFREALDANGVVHRTDDVLSAERELKECIAQEPTFLECYNLYGDVLRKRNRPAAAGAIYHEALRRWPRDGELINQRRHRIGKLGVAEETDM